MFLALGVGAAPGAGDIITPPVAFFVIPPFLYTSYPGSFGAVCIIVVVWTEPPFLYTSYPRSFGAVCIIVVWTEPPFLSFRITEGSVVSIFTIGLNCPILLSFRLELRRVRQRE